MWTSSPDQFQGGVSGRALHDDEKVEKEIAELANRICWDLVSQRGRTTIWQKTSDSACLKSRYRKTSNHAPLLLLQQLDSLCCGIQ